MYNTSQPQRRPGGAPTPLPPESQFNFDGPAASSQPGTYHQPQLPLDNSHLPEHEGDGPVIRDDVFMANRSVPQTRGPLQHTGVSCYCTLNIRTMHSPFSSSTKGIIRRFMTHRDSRCEQHQLLDQGEVPSFFLIHFRNNKAHHTLATVVKHRITTNLLVSANVEKRHSRIILRPIPIQVPARQVLVVDLSRPQSMVIIAAQVQVLVSTHLHEMKWQPCVMRSSALLKVLVIKKLSTQSSRKLTKNLPSHSPQR